MLIADAPPVNYQPGLLTQDIYTIPLELGLIGIMNYSAVVPSKSGWPFSNSKIMATLPPSERNNTRDRETTRHPGRILGLGAGLGTAATLSLLKMNNESFPVWTYLRGWMHAHLATEIVTSWAKLTFRRQRPFYETEKQNGTLRKDDTMSFISGHSAHAFAFSTYAGALLRSQIENPWAGWGVSCGLWGLSSWIATARAVDGQHHWSDILVGSGVGIGTGQWFFNSANKVTNEESASVTLSPWNDNNSNGAAMTLKFQLK